MSSARRALVLVGSPKGRGGISDRLGDVLIERLKENGVDCEKAYVYGSMATPNGREAILGAVGKADTLVFVYPLYIDSIPASMIEAMEMIADWSRTGGSMGAGNERKRLAAVVQSGFPEASQNEVSLSICQRFAKEAGFEWAGGLGIGQGPALTNVNFSGSGGMGGGLKKALGLMAKALADGKELPTEVVELAAKPIMARWLYTFMGDRGFKGQAKRNKADKRLRAKPLAKEGTA